MGPRGPLPVFCTHLNWQHDHSHIRQLQVAALAAFVAGFGSGGFSALVCGDFNAEPTSDEIRMMTGQARCPVPGVVFRDAWRQAGDGGAGFTWSNVNPYAAAELEPSSRIDYVFVAPPDKKTGAGHVVACAVMGDQPVGGVWPSDHFGLIADLRY
jgi:endonuclease/exonuclease/phosphatase family metal-dependent hydrolase